jgi:hypothetical protein
VHSSCVHLRQTDRRTCNLEWTVKYSTNTTTLFTPGSLTLLLPPSPASCHKLFANRKLTITLRLWHKDNLNKQSTQQQNVWSQTGLHYSKIEWKQFSFISFNIQSFKATQYDSIADSSQVAIAVTVCTEYIQWSCMAIEWKYTRCKHHSNMTGGSRSM